MNQPCIFCQIIKEEKHGFKIYEDAFLDLYPVSDGHTLIVPKNHTTDAFTCSPEDAQAVAVAAQKVGRILQEKLHPKGFNLISNNGAMAYQMVMHYHMHVIPKYEAAYGYLISKDTSQNQPVAEVFAKIK